MKASDINNDLQDYLKKVQKDLEDYLEEVLKEQYKIRNEDGDKLIYDCGFLDGVEYICYLLLDKIINE